MRRTWLRAGDIASGRVHERNSRRESSFGGALNDLDLGQACGSDTSGVGGKRFVILQASYGGKNQDRGYLTE